MAQITKYSWTLNLSYLANHIVRENYARTSSSLNRDVFHDMKYPLYEYKICMNVKKLGSRERAKEGEGRQRHHNLRSHRSCHENVTSGGDGEFNLFSVAFNLQSFRDTVKET